MAFNINFGDITGSATGSAISFTGSASEYATTKQQVGYNWEWVSVPSGSQIAKIPPLPNNSVADGWTDMSDNTTLFHFNEDLDWAGSGSYSEDFESTSIGSLPAGWTTFGDAVWEVTGSDSHGGTKSIGSGDINDGQSVSVAYTASLASPQALSFWWKVSSEGGYDFLRFYIDGVVQDSITGTPAWAQKSYDLPAGPSILKWTYVKDGSISGGTDTGWVDDIFVGTPPGSLNIAGSSSFSNFLVSNGAPVSGSNPIIVTSSLGDVRGIKLNQGVKMSTSLTASQLHVTGAEARTIMMWSNIEQTSDNDDKFVFSYGNDTNKGQVGLKKIAMGGLPPGTPDQGNLQKFESYTGNDGYSQPSFFVPNLNQWRHYAVSYETGSNELIWYVDGEMVFVDPLIAGNHSDPNNRTILATTDTAIFIGGDSHNAGTFTSTISASFSEFAVFSSSLPQSQIREIYNKQKSTGFYQDIWDQFPDSGSSTSDWVDMSNNTILYHFDEVNPPVDDGAYQLPDNQASGSILNMSGNTGLWHLGTDVDDSSGNGYNGIINGATLVSGINLFSGSTEFAGAYNFDPPDDVDFAAATATALGINGNNLKTTMLWAKADAWTSNMNLFTMGTNATREDWSLLTRTNGLKLNLWGGDLTWDGMTTDEKNDWIHVACVWDGTDTRLYLNGTERATYVPAGVLNTSDANSLRIGNSNGYNGGAWNGLIQELAIFNEVLPESEILKIYNNQKINIGAPVIIQDSSGYGNNGTSSLNYSSALTGPFSGSTAWSGSGTNTISLGDLPITGSGGLSFSTWLEPTKNLTDEKFYVFDFTNGSNQDISLRKDTGNYGGAFHSVIFEIGAGSVQSRGMIDQISGSVGADPLQSGWVHWVATADGAGSMSLYKDGQLINSASGQGAIPDALRDNNYIGIKSNVDTSYIFEGKLSEFSMWERELNSYEVQKIYASQYSGSSVYNNYGIDVYATTGSFVPDVTGSYVVKVTGTGSTDIDFATASVESGTYDCAGVLDGTAYTNSCGFCVGGTTGLSDDYGKYVCWNGTVICSASMAPITTGSCPSIPPLAPIISGSAEPFMITTDYTLELARNASGQRDRRTQQIPYILSTKTVMSIRRGSDSQFTGSS
jgi:hypothetical protein